MGRGIVIRARHPIDRTHVYDLGNFYNDDGPVHFLVHKLKHLVIQQGFVNNDIPTQKVHFTIDFEIWGSAFKYDPFGVPISGTVHKIQINVDGDPAYKFTKLDLTVHTLTKWYQSGDPFGKFSKLLKGDDKIFGSELSDPDISGGKGNDKLFGKGGDDSLDGSKGDDLSDGGAGNDFLNDIRGHNTFQFSTTLNAMTNVDTIARFRPGDEIYVSHSIVPGDRRQAQQG